jgi:predicted nucleic acid-binding protein
LPPPVFADAAFYIALLMPGDDLHAAAHDAWQSISPSHVITCDPTLVEVLAHLAGLGPVSRRQGVTLIDELRADAGVTVVRQTPELFDAGLALYRRRLDKGYSLTDCMAMVVCHDHNVTAVLTHDRHFKQEGFTLLL